MWAETLGVKLIFIDPGKPNQHAFIVRFNGRIREEHLNEEIFLDVQDARCKAEAWRHEYNEEHEHSWFCDLTPVAFAARSAELRWPRVPSVLPIAGTETNEERIFSRRRVLRNHWTGIGGG